MPRTVIAALLLVGFVLAGCRGSLSDDAPVHVNPNMDWQPRFDPQEANPFFADGRAMRPPVPGTVARGLLREDAAFYAGRTEGGAYLEDLPLPVTADLVERGQDRYDIFCAVCHGKAGDGEGIIMVRNVGYVPAPTYHSDRLRDVADGYLYDVVSNGVRNMPGYAQQIPVADRWAIVAYVRALQRSQNANAGDVPPSVLANIEQGRSANIGGGRTGGAAPAGGDAAGSDTASAGDAAAAPNGSN